MKHSRGVGLIEILVALGLVVVGISGLIKFQATIRFNEGYIKQQIEAIQIAEKQMETLRSFEVIANTTGYTAYNDLASGTTTVNGASATYTVTWTVTPFTAPTYKRIDLTVSWPDRTGATQTVRLSTIVAPIDPADEGRIME